MENLRKNLVLRRASGTNGSCGNDADPLQGAYAFAHDILRPASF